MPFPMGSFGGAFLAGEVVGFIEERLHAGTCRGREREPPHGGEPPRDVDGYGSERICPRRRDDHDADCEEDEDEWVEDGDPSW